MRIGGQLRPASWAARGLVQSAARAKAVRHCLSDRQEKVAVVWNDGSDLLAWRGPLLGLRVSRLAYTRRKPGTPRRPSR